MTHELILVLAEWFLRRVTQPELVTRDTQRPEDVNTSSGSHPWYIVAMTRSGYQSRPSSLVHSMSTFTRRSQLDFSGLSIGLRRYSIR